MYALRFRVICCFLTSHNDVEGVTIYLSKLVIFRPSMVKIFPFSLFKHLFNPQVVGPLTIGLLSKSRYKPSVIFLNTSQRLLSFYESESKIHFSRPIFSHICCIFFGL